MKITFRRLSMVYFRNTYLYKLALSLSLTNKPSIRNLLVGSYLEQFTKMGT